MKRLLFFTLSVIFTFIGCSRSERLTSPEHYILKTSITESVKIDSPAEFLVEIIPTDGFKIEADAPLNLRFHTELYPDLSFEKDLYTKADLLNKDIEKPILKGRVIPKKKGEYIIKGDLSFVVCTSIVCEPKKAEIKFRTTAE